MRHKILYIFLLLIWGMILLFGCGGNKQKLSTGSIYQDSLESLFTEIPEWLMTVYDPASGGFYNNTLKKHSGQFEPDLQSTAFAVTMLSRMNIRPIDSLSDGFVMGVTGFVQRRYDPECELFLDPQYSEKLLASERTLARTQGMAAGIYRRLGIDNYPAPALSNEKTPEYLHSVDAFRTWLENQNWDRVWTAFDRIAMNSTFIKRLPPARADSIIRYIRNYTESIQDDDGLWGKGQPVEIRFSGAAKYGTFCKNMNFPLPNADKIYETVLNWYRQNKEIDFTAYSGCPICVPRNAIRLLEYVNPHLTHGITLEDQQILLQKTYEMLRYYRQSDGGFMKNQLYSGFEPNDINLGRDSVNLVSDMNGTHLAITARKSL